MRERDKRPNSKQAGIPGKVCLALLFAALTAGLCLLLNFLLVDDIHSYSRVMLEEYYAESETVDTVFVGSSHCYRSIDPRLVDEALGTHSFNLGTSQQLPDGSYYLIREAGENSPLKTVYLETFYTGYSQTESKAVPLACFLITDYLRPTSMNRYQYLWEMGGPAAFADLIFPARHMIATPDELLELWRAKLTDGYTPGNYAYVTYEGEEAYQGRGFVYTWGTPPYGFGSIADVDPQAPVSEFGADYLQRIADYCAQQGIRLVMFTAPLPSAYLADTEGYQYYVDYMKAFAAKNGSEYWDFSLWRDTGTFSPGFEDYSDAHHLNGQGAERFTRVFCRVAAASEAGEDVNVFFFDRVEDKLTQVPDATITYAAETAGQ